MVTEYKKENFEENTTGTKRCFIVTPIGDDNTTERRATDGVIEAVIKPVLESRGYEAVAAHQMTDTGSINNQIIKAILNWDLVVVNLTGLNPNVMYELAVRHAVKKPVITICQKGEKLPFDIVEQRTIFYQNDMAGVIELKKNLEGFLDKIIHSQNEFDDNPIYQVLKREVIERKVDESGTPLEKILISKLFDIENQVNKLGNTVSKNKIERKWKSYYFEYVGDGIMKTDLEKFMLKLIDIGLNIDSARFEPNSIVELMFTNTPTTINSKLIEKLTSEITDVFILKPYYNSI